MCISLIVHNLFWGLKRNQTAALPIPNQASSAPVPAIDMSPVDYVARSIAHLALKPTSVNRGFHVVNPNPYPYTSLFKRLRSFGYTMNGSSYAEW